MASERHDGTTTESLAEQFIDAQSTLLDVYYRAYAAHHGDQGPRGCPCCAEFSSEMVTAVARASEALEKLEEARRGT